MTADDFLLSAAVSAPPLCASNNETKGGIGRRVFNAIAARCAAVPCNTNLGIVLLCAPLVQTALVAGNGMASLRRCLEAELNATTVEDAKFVYEAIRMAGAGGMGEVAEQDIALEPTVPLRETMMLAAKHDAIANEYANNYPVIFDTALPCHLELRRRWGYTFETATGLYLFLLAKYPDSLIIRKQGEKMAHALIDKVRPLADEYLSSETPSKLFDKLIRLDAQMKEQGINPGTTADITVACMFVSDLLEL